MEDELRERLLKNKLYENCPGCKLDEVKEMQQGLPIKQLASIWIIVLCSALPISSLFPFIYFMIGDFHVAKTDKDIGYYAGFVGCSLMLGRALTSILWGLVADTYGRKPVMLISICSMIILNTLFGLSKNIWMAICTRFLLGCLNGLLGPVMAYATEVFRKEYQALGLSTVSTAWGMGLIVGPALGGFLAQPAEKYPGIFSRDSIFGRFPYFLPCFCISLFGLAATSVFFWIPETLHIHNVSSKSYEGSLNESEARACGSNTNGNTNHLEGNKSTSKSSLIRNWPLMSAIIVCCVFSVHDMAYAEIFPLWAESPRKNGGLSYSTEDVGVVLVITGIGVMLFSLFLYPAMVKITGPRMIAQIAGVMSVPVLTCYTFMAHLSGFSLSILLNCASIATNLLSLPTTTGMFILQNIAVDQHQRGAANGMSLTVISLFRAIGPACGGALFSWARGRQDAHFLPGDQMLFFILNVIEARCYSSCVSIALLFGIVLWVVLGSFSTRKKTRKCQFIT